MKVAIIIFPGSNCDKDIMKAVKHIHKKIKFRQSKAKLL